MHKNRNKGFSLFETLLYLAIFAIVGGSLFGILTNVVRVSTREISGGEVSSQLQFVMGTINRLVADSSAIEMAAGTATTTLTLRMSNSAQDPTCVMLVNGVLKLAQGPDPYQPQRCTATTTDITTDKVVVDKALFTRNEFPGGHDQVAIDMQLSNTATGASKISRALRSGVSRASAATFDADLLPNQDALYEVGSSIPGGKRWKNASFSGALTVSGNVGIGTSNPTQKLQIGGFTIVGTATPVAIEMGATYSEAPGVNPKIRLWNDNAGSIYGLGVSADQFDFMIPFGARYSWNVGGAEKMHLDANGNLGIGMSAPTYKLQVNGNAANATGVWAVASDERLKRDIVPIIGALRTVVALQGVGFNWKDDVKNSQLGRVMGFIAQDVERVVPQWVTTDGDGYKRLETIGMDALLIEAIKEQQQQIEDLKAEVQTLKNR